MKLATEVSAQKLRGGFYTPAPLVDRCLERLLELLPEAHDARLLEPSAGDGAFLGGLAHSELRHRIGQVIALEPLESEAAKAQEVLGAAGLDGEVHRVSAVHWCASAEARFDAALGNPPFVRFQYLSTGERSTIQALGRRLDVDFKGVSNLWMAVLLGALGLLRAGGAFAFVVPTECLSGYAAGTVRSWLSRSCAQLQLELFPAGSFPGVLQEVLLLSGRLVDSERGASAQIEIVEHDQCGVSRAWRHHGCAGESWTRYLLAPHQLDALDEASTLPSVRPLSSLAGFEVSIVTGANDFFSVSSQTVAEHRLERWARPLLPRIRHAPGLRYTADDHRGAQERGARTWLLDFAAQAPDPMRLEGPRRYLRMGLAGGLHERYKCRVRSPWYRVPGVRGGELLLSKRSHLHPKVVLNEHAALTTDTIYRGRVHDPRVLSAPDLAAGFHNSLTLLSAELEGRSFGGGVLELVPSEIARLSLPLWQAGAGALAMLDRCAREAPPAELVRRTDQALARAGILPAELLGRLAEARELLLGRRLSRNRA